jgi:FeS assembly SUF system regulator
VFRLNRLTDYAVVVLAQLAMRPDRCLSAQELARETAVPLPTVAKVLNALSHDGLVVSQRGAAGGYSLGRAPETLSVASIIQAIEGPIALTACVDGSSETCEVESLCLLRGTWDTVNSAIREALECVSLADVTAGFLPPVIAVRDERDKAAGAPKST